MFRSQASRRMRRQNLSPSSARRRKQRSATTSTLIANRFSNSLINNLEQADPEGAAGRMVSAADRTAPMGEAAAEEQATGLVADLAGPEDSPADVAAVVEAEGAVSD